MQRCTLRKDGVQRGRGRRRVDIQSHMDTRRSGERGGGEKQGKTEDEEERERERERGGGGRVIHVLSVIS